MGTYEKLQRAKAAIPLTPSDYPCPKCGHVSPAFRTDKTTVLVGCEYDCGPYYMPLQDWFEFYDEWDPTPYIAEVK